MTDNSYIDAGVYEHLQGLGLDNWVDPVRRAVDARLSEEGHGDFARWRDALGEIEAATNTTQLRHALMALRPWRKGPFEIGGITIDAEWRSDLKWARVGRGISSLAGRHVLDVGGGNGYYALQMRAAGAASVLVVDPTVLYAMQFQAVQSQSRTEQVWVVPLRLEELPLPARRFDTTFSMGVLYHQRSPLDHLQRLKKTLKPGGELILETIFLPGDEAYARTPIDRYARMRNVWMLPTMRELETWLVRTGYRELSIIDTLMTTTDEQRTTEWMTFDSLAAALEPNDPTLTIEGWPAPHRVIIRATAP